MRKAVLSAAMAAMLAFPALSMAEPSVPGGTPCPPCEEMKTKWDQARPLIGEHMKRKPAIEANVRAAEAVLDAAVENGKADVSKEIDAVMAARKAKIEHDVKLRQELVKLGLPGKLPRPPHGMPCGAPGRGPRHHDGPPRGAVH